MATLVLTAVGGAVGGPIGAAIGAIAGQTIDREVFKPKRREGPRLADLAVQTSRYGAPIPALFGTMRVAGSVIWATELQEHRATSGGKGRAGTTQYSYSASFAVLLSARAILAVRRIWADGKLLRGAAGDFKSATGFRLHLGGEDQAVDPLIAAAEGLANTPALRGCGYAVFEAMALADFGNRIPSLTFEVEAGPATIGGIGEALGGGLIGGSGAALPLGGFAAHGDSARGVLETLALATGAVFAERDGRIAVTTGPVVAVATIADEGADEGTDEGARGKQRGARSMAAIDAVPRAISIGHHDPARDYQVGLQRARRPGAGSREEAIELPAAIAAEGAKALAEAALARAIDARITRVVRLAWPGVAVVPGDVVRITDEAGDWRVLGWTLEAMILQLELVRIGGAGVALSASSGRVTGAPDLVAGTTLLEMFELPGLDDALLSAPRLYVAAAGTGAGWRSAALLASLDGGTSWSELGAARAAVIGRTVAALAAGQALLRDEAGAIEIDLAHSAMGLGGASDAALDSGANLALIGDELIQFGVAAQIGARRWRLSRLLRGRRGTAAGTLTGGARFVLIERDALTVLEVPLAMLGGTARALASGIGDVVPVAAMAVVSGASVLPLTPVHLTMTALPDGGVAVRWVRRSRAGWRWLDGVDAPLGEERAAYRVTIAPAAGSARDLETVVNEGIVAASERSGGAAIVTVRQIGSHGLSAAASIAVPGL